MNNSFSVVYEYNNNLYVNITNRCPNRCVFCIKFKWGMMYRGYNLKLEKEPSPSDVISMIDDMFKKRSYSEIVFCGYGEPLMRWDCVREICQSIRSGKCSSVDKNIKIRINTNGMGNIINGRNILPEMEGIVDSLNISLNSVNREKWYEIMMPHREFEKGSFEDVVNFVIEAKKYVKEVVITAVDLRGVDVDEVRRFANSIGVGFRLRPYLEDYEKT